MYQLFLLCATCVGCVGAAALCRRQEGRSDLRSRCGAPSWSAPAIHLKQTYEGNEDEDNDDIVNEVNKGFISIGVVWPVGHFEQPEVHFDLFIKQSNRV